MAGPLAGRLVPFRVLRSLPSLCLPRQDTARRGSPASWEMGRRQNPAMRPPTSQPSSPRTERNEAPPAHQPPACATSFYLVLATRPGTGGAEAWHPRGSALLGLGEEGRRGRGGFVSPWSRWERGPAGLPGLSWDPPGQPGAASNNQSACSALGSRPSLPAPPGGLPVNRPGACSSRGGRGGRTAYS